MDTTHIIKMQFQTPLHLSRGQTDSYDQSEEMLHSDSLKSAIFVAARMLFGEEIGEEFFNSFRVSSAFPYKGEEYFFPKPMAKLNLKFKDIDEKKEIAKASKKSKKIAYIGKSVFEKEIAGENQVIDDKQLSQNGKFLFSEKIENEDEKKVYKSEVQQRLATAKPFRNEKGEVEMEKDGTPYYIDRIYFTENSGLYFFIDYQQGNVEKIEAAIRLLGDEGVGTDKHVGNGIFAPDFIENFDLKLPENPNANMLLSLYCPKEEELNKDLLYKSSYQLLKRGGYIAGAQNLAHITLRKRSIYMFQEGSVFPKEMNLNGKSSDLKPAKVEMHPVWRDGYAFAIPFLKTEQK